VTIDDNSSINKLFLKSFYRAVPHLDATNLTLDNGVFYGFDVAIRYSKGR
jgi:hypothetical protein